MRWWRRRDSSLSIRVGDNNHTTFSVDGTAVWICLYDLLVSLFSTVHYVTTRDVMLSSILIVIKELLHSLIGLCNWWCMGLPSVPGFHLLRSYPTLDEPLSCLLRMVWRRQQRLLMLWGVKDLCRIYWNHVLLLESRRRMGRRRRSRHPTIEGVSVRERYCHHYERSKERSNWLTGWMSYLLTFEQLITVIDLSSKYPI